jgi:hypothetical protein
MLRNKLTFSIYYNNLDYFEITAETIVETFGRLPVDALPAAAAERMGSRLRRQGIRVKKVKGVRREENDALMRLADAICGLVRDANERKAQMRELFLRAIEARILVDLHAKRK